MISNKDVPADSSPNFVLKHRITGAAFLIIFGVLFLPWILGAPSVASKADVETSVEDVDELSLAEIEQELLTSDQIEEFEEEIEIYVSKITPLDAAKRESESVDKAVPAPPIAEKNNTTDGQPADKEEQAITETVAKVVPPVTPEKPAPTVEKTAPSIEVGWVVQVGVFTDSKGAAKVVADLKAKGFAPSTTIVDTNLGKGTGTRVWLGPYQHRVAAAKSKTSLKDKTGGDGFIRAYP